MERRYRQIVVAESCQVDDGPLPFLNSERLVAGSTVQNDSLTRKWLLDWIHKVILPTCASYGLAVQWVKYCLSERKALHIRIKINPAISALLTLELQFLLGDDAQRVSLNRGRMRAGFDDWNKLFEREGARHRIIYKRLCDRIVVPARQV